MTILPRVALASLFGIVAVVASLAFWGFVESSSSPTSAYVLESQHVVEVASTVAFVVVGFVGGFMWRN